MSQTNDPDEFAVLVQVNARGFRELEVVLEGAGIRAVALPPPGGPGKG